MEEKKASFEPRFEIILANIGLIKKSLESYQEEVIFEFHSFIKDNIMNIIESIPEFKSMKVLLNDSDICFGKKNWEINDDFCAAFIFEWTGCKNTFNSDKDNPNSDPYIGIYFNSSWGKKMGFTKKLNEELSTNFQNIAIEYSIKWEDSDIARYKFIEIAKYGDGEKFNSEKYLKDIINEFRKLVQLSNTIDDIFDPKKNNHPKK